MSFFEFPHTRTYDSDLGWLIKDYKNLDEAIKALNQWKEETQPSIDELMELYTKIITGNFPPAMENALINWIVENSDDVIEKLIKIVFFALDDNGYFVAYIPDSWDEITFGTSGLDDFPAGVDFGHLTLSY